MINYSLLIGKLGLPGLAIGKQVQAGNGWLEFVDYGLGVTGACPASPALQDGVKGHNIKGDYLTGKPRPLGRGASFLGFSNP